MFSSILGQLTGQLERRFLLNSFFPVLVFSLLSGLVVASGQTGVDTVVELWSRQPTVVQVSVLIGYVAIVFVGANLLANGILGITKLFEGYAAPASWFAGFGRNYQRWRASRMEAEQARYRYPPESPSQQFAPTSLGNVLKSAEVYPTNRYGLDAVRVWPRLYHLLPEAFRTSTNSAREAMEFLLAISFLALLFAVGSAFYLICVAAPLAQFITCVAGGSAVSILAYVGALSPASIFGDHIRTAFDLYRLDLLRAMKLPAPATLDEERRMWKHVVRFLEQTDFDHIWRYVATK